MPTVTEHNGGIWEIPLPESAPYCFVRMKSSFANLAEYSVIIVDVHALLALHDRDSLRIAEPSTWDVDKYESIKNFLDPINRDEPELPIVGILDVPKPGWWNHFRNKTHEAVTFTNGRHRARFLRHIGATHIPVEVRNGCKERLLASCGST